MRGTSRSAREPFVGRARELQLCRQLLTGKFGMFYVYGPPGVGKSRLLAECAAMAESLEMPVSRLDASSIRPSPRAVREALIDLPESSVVEPALLVIDGFEAHRALENYYASELWPMLPEGTRLIVAGTECLTRKWQRPDAPICEHALPPFSEVEVRMYLQQRSIAGGCHELLQVRSEGRPLWLSTLAEFAGDGRLESIPGQGRRCTLQQLVSHLLREAPGDEHRAALWAASMVPILSERLLAAMLDLPRSNECYRWLATRPYVTVERGGLVLHGLFREPLYQELIDTDQTLYRQLVLRCGRFHIARVESAREPKQRTRLAHMLMSSLRFEAPVAELYTQLARSPLYRDEIVRGDGPMLDHMVRTYEGAVAAELSAHYRKQHAEGVTVFRDVEGRPVAFMQTLQLGLLGRQDEAADVAVSAAITALHERVAAMLGRRRSHRRTAKHAVLVRSWMDAERYQSMGPGTAELIGRMLFSALAAYELSIMMIVCSEKTVAAAGPLIEDGLLVNLSPEGFVLGEHRYGLLGVDFTSTPVTRFLREALTLMISGAHHPGGSHAESVATW